VTGFTIDRLDHLVLTVRDIDTTCAFYQKVLGMERETFCNVRTALKFGRQKINLHAHPSLLEPRAENPEPGSADFCLVTKTPIDQVVDHLGACGVAIEDGPRPAKGALGNMHSIYFRDPDNNLVEIACYD
jgi:catechol 2,3-dioxygenase-like lactoylglutathione lyase family enzyme